MENRQNVIEAIFFMEHLVYVAMKITQFQQNRLIPVGRFIDLCGMCTLKKGR
tara:strand:+ start:7148 stop:7303 length:156 start_codon:yes stop_codon:yes gene_type:complete